MWRTLEESWRFWRCDERSGDEFEGAEFKELTRVINRRVHTHRTAVE